MRSTRFVSVLVAVCLVASTSCSDSTAPTSTPIPAFSPGPSLVTLNGVIHFGSTRSNPVSLVAPDGSEVVLAGTETASLASVENAEVEVRGIWDASTFVVSDFLVRRVDGTDVMDGILTVLYDDEMRTHDVGYAISLTRGSIVPLLDPPQDLLAHVGERIWLAERTDGQPAAFGVIKAVSNESNSFLGRPQRRPSHQPGPQTHNKPALTPCCP